MRTVKKALKWTAWCVMTAVAAVLVALPFAVPPVVERMVGAKIAEFGLDPDVRMELSYCWRKGPGIEGRVLAAVRHSPWKVDAAFVASCCECVATVSMPEAEFSESEPTIRKMLERYPLAAVSNLTFSGSVALDAKAEWSLAKPVPVWSAQVPIRNVRADLFAQGLHVALDGFAVTARASGLADHVDIGTLHPRFKSLAAAGFTLSDFLASVRITEKAVLVTEAQAGVCGGHVNLYSVFLDPKNLNTGFTLFVDDLEAGEALRHVQGFHGDATGRLHGKVKAFVREGGKSVRLSDAFLYSTPGEVGKLRVQDPEALTDNLSLAGLDSGTCGNVANALTDMDYSVLKLDLKRTEGKNARLSLHVNGTATRGNLSVPVDLTLNINGELEQLINTGLGYSNLTKGKKK